MVRTRLQARVSLKAAVMSLGAVVVLASSAVAQGETESPAPAEPQSNSISVRIAEAFANDPEALFRFVADHVRYEPYSGALRGAEVTYYGRAGNSVDQSLLLARLLDAAGIQTRFAVGRIDDETASLLLAAAVADEGALREQAAAGLFGRLPDGEQAIPAVPRAADFTPIYEPGNEERVEDWATEELRATLEMIRSALEGAAVTTEGGFAPVPSEELESHVWVQALIGDEWVDLDPSLPANEVGVTLAEPVMTMDAIPPEMTHQVQISVIGESLREGALVEEELIAVTGTAEELAGEPIAITNVGSEALPQLAQAFGQVLGVESVHPVLMIGDAHYAGARMQFKAGTDEDGGGLGGGFFDTGSAVDEVTAQWIEMTLTSPGRDPVTIRRVVFDRLGDDGRQTGSVQPEDLSAFETVDVDGDGELEYAALNGITWLTVSTGMPSPRARVAGLDDESDGAAAIVPYAHHLLNAFAGLDWAVPLGVRPFADGPNVTALVGAVDVGPDGEPILNSALDIWHRSYAAAPVAGIVFEGDPATIPGVLAYVTERMMAGHGLPGGEPFGSVGVGEVFETSLSGGVPVRAVTSTSDLDALVVAPPARRRLEAGIARGLIAIVPAESVSIDGRQRTGWWLVDPATGRVADQMDDGKGAVSETSLLLRVVAIFGAGALLGWIAKAIKEAWCSKAWSDVTNKLDSELRF